MHLRRSIAAFLIGLSVTLAAACGGGSGGGGGGGAPVPGFDGTFTPDLASPGNLTVSLDQAPAGGGDLVVIQVTVTDTSDVFGADFTIDFDPTTVQYVSRSAGSLLESGGQGVVYETAVPEPGRLVVGASRVAAVPGVDVVGTRVLVNLTFRATAPGTSTISFTSGDLLNSQPPEPQPIAGLSWFGGTLVAN